MIRITEVHYIMHLTYDLDIRPEETRELIDDVVNFCRRVGRDPSRLFILEVNGFSHYKNSSPEIFNAILLEYFRQSELIFAQLITRLYQPSCWSK